MFRSLSQVAKAITGTNWNGHRFFGQGGQERRFQQEHERRAKTEPIARYCAKQSLLPADSASSLNHAYPVDAYTR